MNKKIVYIVMGIVCGILLLVLGICIGNNCILNEKCSKDSEKVVESEVENSNDEQENIFYEIKMNMGKVILDDYIVLSASKHGNQKMFIYDNEGISLVKELDNAWYIEKVNIGDKIGYQVDINLNRGGDCSTTYILDKDFNIIVDNNKLPEKKTGMDEGLFSAYFNSNGTIAILVNDIYVYDYEGNLIKTIETNDNVTELVKDYYLVKKDGKIKLLRYDNKLEFLIEDNKNMNLITAPVTGSSGITFKNSKLELSLVENEGTVNPVCYTYTFIDKNQKLTLLNKQKSECDNWPWVYGEN